MGKTYTPATRNLKVNFYHLGSATKFERCLQDIEAKSFADRIVEYRGMRYRLREVQLLKGGLVVAELRTLRTRSSGEVPKKEHLKSGAEKEFDLETEEAFSECTALLYDPVSQCILVQDGEHTVSVGTIVSCVERACSLTPGTFEIDPVWVEGFLKELQKSGHISKFTLNLAHDPTWLLGKTGKEMPIDASAELLDDIGGRNLVLTVSIDREDGGSLRLDGIMKTMRTWAAREENGSTKFKAARINVQRGKTWRWLNLFEHRLKDSDKVELTPTGGVTLALKTRALMAIWGRHEDALRERYRERNGQKRP